jgi:hypothetical protein
VGALLAFAPGYALASFGFEGVDVTFEEVDGSSATQAGSHPFAMTTTLRLSAGEDAGFESPDGDLRNLRIDYPAGFILHPTAVPACPMTDFVDIEGDQNACSDSTAVGIARVTASSSGPVPAGTPDFRDALPLYRLVPIGGSAARIGFVAAGQPVVAELGIEQGPPHSGYLEVVDLTQAALFYSARISVWGVPAAPAHDADRGHCAFLVAVCPANIPQQPFLTLPRSCSGPMATVFTALSWGDPGDVFEASSLSHDGAEPPQPLGLTGCGSLAFTPQVDVQPTAELADTPSGLDFAFDVVDEGLFAPGGIAQSELKKIVLDLPEGMIVNPAVAEGIADCTPAQLAQETVGSAPGDGCPLGSQVGAVKAETAVLPSVVLEGRVFAAEGNGLYVVVKDPELGILVKQAGAVEYDPSTEQLTATFDYLPQLPVSSIGLHLDDGLLLTPAACDEFFVAASMSPWSEPGSSFLATSSFEIVAGPDGGACPSGREPQLGPGTGGSNPSPVGQPVAIPPTPLPSAILATRRPCPFGKRRVAGKARCVRKPCRRARQGKRAARRCARPKSRRRR